MWYKVFSGAMDSETQEGKPMTDTAKTITTFRERAERLHTQAWSLPVWGISEGYQEAYDADGFVYRLKDQFADCDWSARYRRAADWLEERASAPTLAALYPDIVVR
jgi:hypothetical protein